MFSHYLNLATLSLKNNVVLTVIMIAASGIGIGASMAALTKFRAMAVDPIPDKSRQLFAVQIDKWRPREGPNSGDQDNCQEQISYTDAIELMNVHAARRQSAMYATGFALSPSNPQRLPFQVEGRGAYADFITDARCAISFQRSLDCCR